MLSLGDHTFYFYLNFYLHHYLDSSWGNFYLEKNRKTPSINSLFNISKQLIMAEILGRSIDNYHGTIY